MNLFKNDTEKFEVVVKKEHIIEYLKDNDVVITKEILDNLDRLPKTGFVNNDLNIECSKLLELWKLFDKGINTKILKDHYYIYELEYISRKIYEISTNLEWRRHNLELMAPLLEPWKDDLKKLNELLNEMNFLIDPGFIGFVPIYWIKNFEIIKSNLKGSKSQGENNGPDFIFKDKLNGKTIGVEITLIKPNKLIIDKSKVFNYETIIKQWTGSFKKNEGLLGTYQEIDRIIKKHTSSIEKYEKCDQYVLVLVTNNCLPEYLYCYFESIANAINSQTKERINNKWRWIFIF